MKMPTRKLLQIGSLGVVGFVFFLQFACPPQWGGTPIGSGTTGTKIATCDVTRWECTGWTVGESRLVTCPQANRVYKSFAATRCVASSQSPQDACNYYCQNGAYQNGMLGQPPPQERM